MNNSKKKSVKREYVAITGLAGRDELYLLSSSKLNKFEKLFGSFYDHWNDHESAMEWIQRNCKLIGFCTCVS